MRQKYVVQLSAEERSYLQGLIAAGTAPARKLARARMLLKSDQGPDGPGWTDVRVADAVETSQPTVARVRQQYVEEGLEATLNRRAPNRVYARKLDGEQEAQLIALACGVPPAGHVDWNLRLLANQLVELEIVESISHQTVGRVLKKTNSSPIGKRSG